MKIKRKETFGEGSQEILFEFFFRQQTMEGWFFRFFCLFFTHLQMLIFFFNQNVKLEDEQILAQSAHIGED